MLALVDAGADINAKTYTGWTHLHGAAAFGETETVLALIKAGADIEAKDNEGITPLYDATIQGKTETALVLINAGADLHIRANNGKTALDAAIEMHGENSDIALALKKAMNK